MLSRLLLSIGLLLTAQPAADAQMVGAFVQGTGISSGGTPPSCSYPLPVGTDTVAAAYSFRKLYSFYAGSAVRLVRASDSAATDIGFAGCDFDAASASSFCASTSCTVSKWYDQSGNGAAATSVSTAASAGYTATCQAGKPCANFVVGGTPESYSATLSASVAADTFASVAMYRTPSTSEYVASTGSAPTTNGTGLLYSTSSSTCSDIRFVGGSNAKATMGCSLGTFYRLAGTNNNTLSRSFVSGVAGTDVTTTFTIASTTSLAIGTAGSNYLNGQIAELIVFSPDISTADLGTLSANQATYWGVP